MPWLENYQDPENPTYESSVAACWEHHDSIVGPLMREWTMAEAQWNEQLGTSERRRQRLAQRMDELEAAMLDRDPPQDSAIFERERLERDEEEG